MVKGSEKQTAPVRRITIDEKLGDNLIRILIANLKDKTAIFSDDSIYWKEEKEDFVRREDYQSKMEIPDENVEEWPWARLHEGQVFLSGRFQMHDNLGAKTAFVVDLQRRNFQRIDQLFKDSFKRKYLAALERSTSDGETNRIE